MSDSKNKKFWKWALLFSVIDFLFIAGSIIFFNADHDGFIRFFWLAGILILQVIVGLIFTTYDSKRVYGQAFLLASVFMLIAGWVFAPLIALIK